jgi:hypothetical protein
LVACTAPPAVACPQRRTSPQRSAAGRDPVEGLAGRLFGRV